MKLSALPSVNRFPVLELGLLGILYPTKVDTNSTKITCIVLSYCYSSPAQIFHGEFEG